MATRRPTEESEDTGTPAAAYEKPLSESLEDASVLLWYATREGKQVSEKALKDIVQAQLILTAGTQKPEVEGRFWVAYRELAKAVQPASVDSILATYSYPFGNYGRTGKRRLPDATATKKRYTGASVFVLGFLLLVQIYWFIGSTWRTDLEVNRTELDGIAGALREKSREVEAETELAKLKDQEISEHGAGEGDLVAAVVDGSENGLALVKDQLRVLMEQRGRTDLDTRNVVLRGERVQAMLYGNSRMLNFWDVVTDLVAWLKGESGEGSGNGSGEGISNDAGDNDISPEQLIKTAKSFEKQHLGVEHALVNSKSMLAILSQYFLPLLYGLLGSLAYILRTLSREIQNVTFTRGSEIRYSLRWPLGMLGGVTVGLFFDPADLSGFAAITPLGLAFLAGYGVELLFTGLDRMVSAFTGEGTERPKAA